jgi:hypothetical protein
VLPGTAIGGRIVAELGLTVLDTSDGAPGAYSLEQIPDILGPADMILSFDYGGLADQEANQLFRALPAVRAGGYVTVTTDAASACYQESSLSLRWVAPEIADAVRTAAASACPTEELAKYRTDEYTSFVQEQLAERFRLPVADVDVVAGRVALSDDATQRKLGAALGSFANKRDPDDPSKTYEALTIQYLSEDGEAVTDSCYKDAGGSRATVDDDRC